MNNLKILVFGQTPPPVHGSNIMTSVFLDALKELGLKHRLVNKHFSKSSKEVEIFKPMKIVRLFKVYMDFLNHLVKFRPNLIVYFISSRILGLLPDSIILLTAHIMKIPFILYVHGKGHDQNNAHLVGGFIYRAILSKAIALLILSEKLKADVNFISNNIYILPNCLPQDNHNLQEDIFSILKKEESHKLKILFLSNLYESKGVMTLLNAIPLILNENSDIEFNFIGGFSDETFEDKVYSLINNMGLKTNVQFLGPQYGKNKFEEIYKSDILVFPTNNDVFPLVLLEAMASGLPVISTNIGAIPEIVDHDITGLVIPPKNPELLAENILKLTENRVLLESMGVNGRKKYLKEYSFNAYKNNLEKIVNDIVINLKIPI
jgi:glycosyltransferase involved in cell wall biosynthesis